MSDPVTLSQNKLARGAWLVVGLLWIVAMLNYLDRQVLVTMRDAVKEDIPMTDTQFGMLTTVFLWIYGALSPVGGFLADKFGRRPVIFISLAVWSIVTWWTGHTRTYHELLTARALMGVSEACYIPAALALITDYHRGGTRSLATGLHMSGLYAGMVLGGLGGYLATPDKALMGMNLYVGWSKAFAIFGGIGVAYALLLMLLLPKDADEASTAPLDAPPSSGVLAALTQLCRESRFWMLMAVIALVGACNWVVLSWLPAFLKEHFHLQDGPAGLHATTWGTAAKFAAVLLGGALADRFSRRSERARALIPAFGLLLAAPGIFGGTLTQTLACGLLGFSLQGVAQGFLDANLMPMLRNVAGRNVAATGYGLLNFISCATGGVMVAFGGKLKDSGLGFETLFRISAVGILIGAIVLLCFKPGRTTA